MAIVKRCNNAFFSLALKQNLIFLDGQVRWRGRTGDREMGVLGLRSLDKRSLGGGGDGGRDGLSV